MSNARITFEVEGVKRSLYFGMVATEIITEKTYLAAISKKKIGNIKSFAYVVYAGLCNDAELKDLDYPDFEETYILAETLLKDAELSAKIQNAWTESEPYKEQMERLNGVKKKAEVKPKPKKPTG